MWISPLAFGILILAAAGAAMLLYIMRRRVRLGKRTPKF